MDLKDKTSEQLEGDLKGLKFGTGILIGLLIVLFAACLYGLVYINESGMYTALVVVPIALSAVIPMNYKKIKAIEAELKARK